MVVLVSVDAAPLLACCFRMFRSVPQCKSVLCTLVDKNDQSRYVCFTQKTLDGLNIGLSNGDDVWKTDVSEEALTQLKKNFLLKSTEDYALKLKGACKSGTAYVSLREDGAVLHLGPEPADLNVTFTKLTNLEGQTELKELLFTMADILMRIDAAGVTPSSSPVKSPQKRLAEFEPKKHHTGPTIAARKRLPGDSLINPGTKRKQPATGVNFDEEDQV